jgi:hypothetical protein
MHLQTRIARKHVGRAWVAFAGKLPRNIFRGLRVNTIIIYPSFPVNEATAVVFCTMLLCKPVNMCPHLQQSQLLPRYSTLVVEMFAHPFK